MVCTMVRMCICCKYRLNKHKSDRSLYGFPKDNKLRKKWLQIIRTEKICESARICSRHFKEDDFRYSLIGGKRFLKQGAIPSLFLNAKINNNQSSDNKDEDTENNQVTEDTNKRIINIIDSQSLNTVELHKKKDDKSQQIIEECGREMNEQTDTENISTKDPQFMFHNNLKVPETISSLPCRREPARKRKRYLYDVQWEEISTSPAQARVYWEVAIGKIMKQKVVIKTLRQSVRRLKGKILQLRTLVKKYYKK